MFTYPARSGRATRSAVGLATRHPSLPFDPRTIGRLGTCWTGYSTGPENLFSTIMVTPSWITRTAQQNYHVRIQSATLPSLLCVPQRRPFQLSSRLRQLHRPPAMSVVGTDEEAFGSTRIFHSVHGEKGSVSGVEDIDGFMDRRRVRLLGPRSAEAFPVPQTRSVGGDTAPIRTAGHAIGKPTAKGRRCLIPVLAAVGADLKGRCLQQASVQPDDEAFPGGDPPGNGCSPV